VFCDIDATEYLDDLWGRHGLHLHVNISKFEEVRLYVRVCTIHSAQSQLALYFVSTLFTKPVLVFFVESFGFPT